MPADGLLCVLLVPAWLLLAALFLFLVEALLAPLRYSREEKRNDP